MSDASVGIPADDSAPGVVKDLLGVLWFVAGSAMLVFTIFLAVLVVAGIGFRLGPRTSRRRPAVVFAVSTLAVVVSAAVLLFPGSFRKPSDAPAARAAGVDAVHRQPARIYPAVSGMPLRYANGGASGAGMSGATSKALVLYGAPAAQAGLAELSATKLVNLVSHFGAWTAHPVGTYHAGEMAKYDAVFYLGEGLGAGTLPAAFLDDVLRGQEPVMWINGDIGQLRARNVARWNQQYGFTAQGHDTAQIVQVRYKGVALPVHQVNEAGLVQIGIDDPSTVKVLATAVGADGSTLPWALRSRNLIYVSEDPLPYISSDNDRYLAFGDLLFEALAPATAQRHRALVRLEDVGPTADPVKLRAITDYLFSQGVPFSVGVYPVYRDPHGVDENGVDTTIRLSERPALVAALVYATEHGGSLVMHGYTHQYATADNPHNGQSGQDAEFYLCHLDDANRTQLDGPVPEDSGAWALGRIDQGLAEIKTAGLPRPLSFEFPHYMASAVDYVAAGKRFDRRYERTLYFPGLLSDQPVDDAQRGWQFFPYAVRDVYGATVFPENMDYVSSNGDSIPGMLDTARSNLVVRDGVASFFYHPFLGLGQLPRLVDGIRALGYTFVGTKDLAASP